MSWCPHITPYDIHKRAVMVPSNDPQNVPPVSIGKLRGGGGGGGGGNAVIFMGVL